MTILSVLGIIFVAIILFIIIYLVADILGRAFEALNKENKK